MFRLFAFLFLIFTTSAIAAELTGSFSPRSLDFGEIYQFGTVSVDLDLQNTSQDVLEISRIDSARADVVAVVSKNKVMPGESVRLTAKIPTLDRVGKVSFHFDIFTDQSDIPNTRVVLRGFVDWIVDPSSTKIDLGLVDAQKGAQISRPISVRSGEKLKLVSIEQQGKFLDARIEDDGTSIRIETKKGIPWGIFSESIYVKTDSSKQPRVAFAVSADVRGDVVPSSNPLEIGVVEAAQGFQQKLRLDGPEGKELRIGKIEVDGQYVESSAKECIPKLLSCKYIILASKDLPEVTTNISGVIKIELPDFQRVLPIAYSAMIVKSGTTVRNLNDEMEKSSGAPVSISSVIKSSLANPVEMKRPTGEGPLLSWRVANEWGVYGYEIFRSRTKDGEFQRMNNSIIRRLSNLDQATGSVYFWRDTDTVVGEEYWYEIRIVYDSGSKQLLSAAQKVISK